MSHAAGWVIWEELRGREPCEPPAWRPHSPSVRHTQTETHCQVRACVCSEPREAHDWLISEITSNRLETFFFLAIS